MKQATLPNCGNLLRAFVTTHNQKCLMSIQGNDLEYSKNTKDWTIRSQAPTFDNARIWRRFRDYMVVGLRDLAHLCEGIRYSPASLEILRKQQYLLQYVADKTR